MSSSQRKGVSAPFSQSTGPTKDVVSIHKEPTNASRKGADHKIECQHFSILKYVYDMRLKNPTANWPFAGNPSEEDIKQQLPSMPTKKYKDGKGLNCLLGLDSPEVSSNEERRGTTQGRPVFEGILSVVLPLKKPSDPIQPPVFEDKKGRKFDVNKIVSADKNKRISGNATPRGPEVVDDASMRESDRLPTRKTRQTSDSLVQDEVIQANSKRKSNIKKKSPESEDEEWKPPVQISFQRNEMKNTRTLRNNVQRTSRKKRRQTLDLSDQDELVQANSRRNTRTNKKKSLESEDEEWKPPMQISLGRNEMKSTRRLRSSVQRTSRKRTRRKLELSDQDEVVQAKSGRKSKAKKKKVS